jgi:hypothetical protein
MGIVDNRLLIVLLLFACVLALCFTARAWAADKHPLPLSSMQVEITSQGKRATFRLYDTRAARELYDQLPLTLDLTNFRDAQWMFYPPKKLNVKPSEAYHDGKKGELSYYEPWGDAFMLYEDFYAGDEMHRLGVGLSGVDDIAAMAGTAVVRKLEPAAGKEGRTMQITVKGNGNTIVYELNDSPAARDLYGQLPLSIEVENYGGNEKIYYPPKKLGTANTPLVKKAENGTLAYYAPWGDVVMFYGGFGSASGLYELGRAIKGSEHIRSLSGTITIEASR